MVYLWEWALVPPCCAHAQAMRWVPAAVLAPGKSSELQTSPPLQCEAAAAVSGAEPHWWLRVSGWLQAAATPQDWREEQSLWDSQAFWDPAGLYPGAPRAPL